MAKNIFDYSVNSTQLTDQVNSTITQRNTQTMQTVNQISLNKQEALATLDTQMKIPDRVGDAGAALTILFIVLFIVWIILCDCLKLLSFLKIIKPIKMLSLVERKKLRRRKTKLHTRNCPQPRRTSEMPKFKNYNRCEVNGMLGSLVINGRINETKTRLEPSKTDKTEKMTANHPRRSLENKKLRQKQNIIVEESWTSQSNVSEFYKHPIRAKPNFSEKNLKNVNPYKIKEFSPVSTSKVRTKTDYKNTEFSSRSSSSFYSSSFVQL